MFLRKSELKRVRFGEKKSFVIMNSLKTTSITKAQDEKFFHVIIFFSSQTAYFFMYVSKIRHE